MPRRVDSFLLSGKAETDRRLQAINTGLSMVNEKVKSIDIFEQLSVYKDYPIAFAEQVLKVTLTPDQKRILTLLHRNKRVLCAASHAVGKSYISAVAILHMFFTVMDSTTIVTAPTARQISNVIFATVRDLNNIDQNVYRGEYSPKLWRNESHWAMGFSSNSGDALQGVHSKSGYGLLVIDEAVGVHQRIFEGMEGLVNNEVRFLAICNPTTIDCHAYDQWTSGRWTNLRISALNHPNIIAELKGEEPPFPSAIRLDHLNNLVREWTTQVHELDRKPTDIEWPPGSGNIRRPNQLFQTRVLGLWPDDSSDNVFSQLALEFSFNSDLSIDPEREIGIGVDIARGGNDYSVISVRIGEVLVEIIKKSGAETLELAGLVASVAKKWALDYDKDMYEIPINLDTTGLGVGVHDVLKGQGFNVFENHFNEVAQDQDLYPNLRSEIWLDLAERCKNGEISFALVAAEYGDVIRSEALAPTYSYDLKGRKLLEKKDDTRKRTKKSPDTMDSIALCYYKQVPTISVSIYEA